MSDISKIKLPNGDIYNLKDNEALHQGDATLGAITGIVKQNSGLLTITDGASNYPIEELKITFGPLQERSGDPTPTNVRSIIGHTGIQIYKADKAPINGVYSFMPIQSGSGEPSPTNVRTIIPGLTLIRDDETILIAYGGTLNLSTKTLTVTYVTKKIQELGVGYNPDGYFYSTISGKANGLYNIISEIYQNTDTGAASMPNYSIKGTASNTNVFFMDKRYTATSAWLAGVGDTYIAYEVATPTTYILSDTEVEKTLIVLGINKNTYKIEFPEEAGTVYGGTVDLASGLLTKTWNSFVGTDILDVKIDSYDTTAVIGKLTLDSSIPALASTEIISSRFSTNIESGNVGRMVYVINTSALYIVMPRTDFSGTLSGNSIKGWLTDHPTMFVYPLATPITYQLTPQQIRTICGENNIWSDINSTISIKYAADAKLFIQQNTVKDVQINNASITNNGVANIPIANSNTLGTIKTNYTYGLTVNNDGTLVTYGVGDGGIKSGNNWYQPLMSARQHQSVFYGLAKAAGDTTQSASDNAIGTYTDAAKGAIQHMIGTDAAIAPYEADITADRSYAIDDTFMLDGKLYKATAAIVQSGVITPNINCIETTIDENYVKDIQIDGTSIINNGVATIPLAELNGDYGLIKLTDGSGGITISTTSGKIITQRAGENEIKAGSNAFKPIVPQTQHRAVFYGLAKAAGDITQASSDNAIGTYTNEAKTAIQQMLGLGTINASSVAASLNTTAKTYLLGTQTAITSTAANVNISGDTGVYLTTNQGQISATQHSININGTEKAYMTYNTTDQSIDFIFV